MSFKTLPPTVSVELSYPYMIEDGGGPVTYVFPRLRKKDVEMEKAQARRGDGTKDSAAVRLAGIVENIFGWEEYGLLPRQKGESVGGFRQRVIAFFDNEEYQENAEHALVYRSEAIFPVRTFPSVQDSSVQIDNVRSGVRPGAALPVLHQTGEGSSE